MASKQSMMSSSIFESDQLKIYNRMKKFNFNKFNSLSKKEDKVRNCEGNNNCHRIK